MLVDRLTANKPGPGGVWGELAAAYGHDPRPPRFQHNQVQFTWGFIAAMTIGMGLRPYRISTMYIEFENVADPSDPVVNPGSFGRDDNLSYYDDLGSTPSRDFLRVALLQTPMLGIANGYANYFTDGVDGNKLTFTAMTGGVTGVHGKTFSDSVNSKVCGAALVAAPVFADRTQDVIFSRGYLTSGNQLVKEASGQVVITWPVYFG